MSIDPTKPLVITDSMEQKPVDNRRPNGQFGAGNNANPNGRPPKDWTFKDLIDEVAEEFMTVQGKDGTVSRQTYKKLLIKKMFQKAVIEGDVPAAKELMNRRDGMPKQKVDLEAEGTWNITMKRDEQ